MSFLMMVFLAAVCLFPAYPPPPWDGPSWLSPLLALAGVLIPAAFAAFIAHSVHKPLEDDPTLLEQQMSAYDGWRRLHNGLLLGLYLAALGLFGYGWWVRSLYPEPEAGGLRDGFGCEVLLLLPYLLAQAASQWFFYDADRAAHVASHRLLDLAAFAPGIEGRVAPVPPFGDRLSYVVFQLRQKLALALVPVMLLVFRQEVFRLLPEAFARDTLASMGLTIAGFALVLLGLPLLVRLVLGLRSLEEGPLRRRLMATADRLGLGLSDILVWDTRGGMANAMIIGLVPWMRYVVFTDRLLEEFTPEEVQAVFGHELGHVKHQHMLYYLVFLGVSMLALALFASHYLLPPMRLAADWLSEVLPGVLPAEMGTRFLGTDEAAMLPMMALSLAYIFIVFGYVSRRCERQADIYGCRAVSCAGGCTGHPGHGTEAEYAGEGPLCPTGIATFVRALDKVAHINGIDRHDPGFLQSWQHGTIAGRVEYLQGLLADPREEPAFQWRFAAAKWLLAVGLGAVLAVLVALHGLR